MKLYNTKTMKKDEFVPLKQGKVSMYSCGPTVYNYFHIGNARPLIVFDALRRYLEYRGHEVTYVQNFTDIDDRIINRANEEGVSTDEIAKRYIREYFTDACGLGVNEATVHPKATENVPQMIEMISTLIEKGLAYESDGDVYYRTSNFKGYGMLSRQPMDELMAGARIETTDIKENPMDFVLWKSSKQVEPYWSSPWGNGRPGWHIECSAMALRFLGQTIDIHSGGQDLIFPHHENEIAQSEGANGCEYVRYWLHNGFINIDNEKMSKSLGNFFTVRDISETHGYESIRMFMLMSHYRSPLSFSNEVLEQSKNALTRIKTAKNNLAFISENGSESLSDNEKIFTETLPRYRDRFCEALDDDFNTADALAVIFELVRETNSISAKEANPSKAFALEALKMLEELTDVLGLLYADVCGDVAVADEEVEALIEERCQARAEKNWARADEIRNKLSELGITLEDTPQGVKWRKG